MPEHRFQVNGKPVAVDVDEATPLLFVLRNDLGLKGAKLGCGSGHCGACTVIVDGNPVNACTAPMWSMNGVSVETVEGAGRDAVFDAFLDAQAAQCGYCIPGILMSARALLQRDPPASADEVVAHLAERHICRCGTHRRILDAIEAARQAV
ncbi:(2Fe-2S)-binding protein [Marivita hallyeonensis]|uniref:Nicotinate dehydrogenase subunit A n=1 Tax=Marivita hallyeonensis TaxID=996342 RepID=A0A1M5SBJ7_9RHOB|nr:(2Fe-2S)-binding protein [Marivita hallyeonensis]SHH36002.1 nicotinate dehydrogenase subunit A [Marivita hallyeonensis]